MLNEISMDEARRLLAAAKALGIPANPCVPAAIGSGPVGETCGTCRHRVLKRLGGTYQKCELMEAHWTCGAGSDVKAKWPACKYWEAKTKEPANDA